MGSHPGKAISAIGGILILVASYLLVLDTGILGISQASGINAIFNFTLIFGMDIVNMIISLILAVLFLLAGILVLIGIKSRALSIIGSLLPLILGVMLILEAFIALPFIESVFGFLYGNNEIVAGILPYSLPLAGIELGAIILTVGGLLGFIGGCMGR